jgi:hypothetical protein
MQFYLPSNPGIEVPMSTNTILLVILIVFLFGGGGFYWSRRGH